MKVLSLAWDRVEVRNTFFVFRLRSEKLLGIFFVLDQKLDYRDGFFKIWIVPY